jgi:hypothetical protein
MGNDKQIAVKKTSDSLEQTKAAFLPQSFKDPEKKPEQYLLEDEYAKAKKNRQIFLYFFVASFIALIIISAVIIISVIQSRSKKIELNIRDFEDVKLKELIDSSKKGENQIDQLRRQIIGLDRDYQDELEKIGREFDSKKDGIQMMDLSESERAGKTASLAGEESKKKAKTESEYKAKRKKIEDQIAAEQKAMQEKGASAKTEKSFGDIFGGEDKLFKIQMDKVSDRYDQKIAEEKERTRKEKEDIVLLYNPIFQEKFVVETIQKPVPSVQSRSEFFSGLSDSLAIESAISKDQLSKLNEDMKRELAITGRLRQVPFKNSVQRAVMHSDSLTKSIFNTYDSVLQKLVASLDGKNLSLKYYNYAFEYMTKSQQENGYILDARNPAAIGVYFNKVHKVRSGDLAFVFRSDDDYIGTIKFKQYKGILVAELVDKASGRDMRPFDKIMFKMERDQK